MNLTLKRIFLIALVACLIDQFSKWYVVWHLNLREINAIDVLPPILNFRMAWNEGVNFGLFSNDADVMRWVLIAVAVGLCTWLVYWGRQFSGWWAAIFLGLILGGAIGNVIDRLAHGAVVDFLNMSCCGINNPYAFNIADIWVFAGAIGLLIFGERLPKNT